MEEIWKDVVGYEGLYQVSSYGRIKSLDRTVTNGNVSYCKKGRLLSFSNNGTGYLFVNLSKNGNKKREYVHRIVAKMFIENPNNLSQINHIDENKSNNAVWNLEWCNSLYNNRYGSRLERLSKKRGKAISQYNLDGTYIRDFDSINKAALSVNRTTSNIRECLKGNVMSCAGYLWRISTGSSEDIKGYNKKKTEIVQCDINGNVLSAYKSAS